MSQFEEMMDKYVNDLKTKCGVDTPDVELLTKVAKSLGPSIYNKDSGTVAISDKTEMDGVKNNFLIKKLGLEDNDDLKNGLNEVIDLYGRSNPTKHRAVMYYLLARRFGKESVFA